MKNHSIQHTSQTNITDPFKPISPSRRFYRKSPLQPSPLQQYFHQHLPGPSSFSKSTLRADKTRLAISPWRVIPVGIPPTPPAHPRRPPPPPGDPGEGPRGNPTTTSPACAGARATHHNCEKKGLPRERERGRTQPVLVIIFGIPRPGRGR